MVVKGLPWVESGLSRRTATGQKRPHAILPVDVVRAWLEAGDYATGHAPAIGTAVRLMFGLGLREGE